MTRAQLKRCSPLAARSVLRGTVGNALVRSMRALVEVGDTGMSPRRPLVLTPGMGGAGSGGRTDEGSDHKCAHCD